MDGIENSRYLIELDRQKKLVWILGLAGLVPFALPTLLVFYLGMPNPLSEPLVAIFRNYSVVILSFLGGIRWGSALYRVRDEDEPADTISVFFSVIPALLAWATMFLSLAIALPVLLLAFCAQGAWDSLSAQANKLPRWFASVRMVLTIAVALAHLVMILATA